MGLLVVIVSIVISATFAVAGVAKLRDPEGTEQAVAAFGVHGTAGSVTARLLPISEVLVAVGIIVPLTRRWAALAAGLLLVVFVIAMAVALARGRRPDCHCFGQVHSSPVGGRTIVRNVVLAGAAGLVAWYATEPIGHVDGAVAAVVAAGVALAAAVAVQGWLLLSLLHRHGEVLLRLEALESAGHSGSAPAAATQSAPQSAWGGLPVGSDAPGFDLEAVGGERVRLEDLTAPTGMAMLLFTDPGCGPCRTLMPDVAGWQQRYRDRLTVAVVSAGNPADVEAHAREFGLDHVLLDPGRRTAESYKYLGTPGAVVVDRAGTIATSLAAGAPAIRELVDEVALGRRRIPVRAEHQHEHRHEHRHDHPPSGPVTVPAGAEPPSFALPDLDGHTVELAAQAGHETLLLFWNPGCGFCQRMAPDLRAWETAAGTEAPRLLVIAAGDAEPNRAFGFAAPVLLDADQAVTRSYGITGTPMAVLIDRDGRVASAPAVGADAVFGLLRVGAPA